MKKLIFLFAAVVLVASCRAQCPGIPVKTSGIVYSCGTPQWVPVLKTGSEIDIDTTTGHIYQWHRTNNSWLQLGQGIDYISGAMPPLYTPVRNMSLFAINASDELYHYSGGSWAQINQGEVYTAGTGIDITGNEITNTAPDQTVSITGGGISSVTGTYPNFTVTSTEVDGSTTNELQTLSVAANTATLSNSGGSVTIAGAGINTVSTVGSTITVTGTEVDGSVTNEAQTISAGGTTSPTIGLSTAGGAGGGTITLSPAGIMSFSRSGNTITATATEVDGSVTNEIELPTQTGNSGKYLTTDGSSPSWATVGAGVTGSGAANQITTWNGTSAVTGSANLTYTSNVLKAIGSTSQLQLGDVSVPSTVKFAMELDNTRSNFRIYNTAGTQVFNVRNDGVFEVGATSGGFVVGAGTSDANVSGQFMRISPPAAAATSDQTNAIGSVAINGRLGSATSGFSNILSISSFASNFTPTSGTRQVQCLLINPIYNQTGTASGNIYGIRYSPTVTSVLGAHYGLIIEPNCRNGIGTASPAASAALDITSTTTGFLPPRMTTAQRNAISSPATGLTLYCTDCTATDASTGVMQTYNGSTWKNNW